MISGSISLKHLQSTTNADENQILVRIEETTLL